MPLKSRCFSFLTFPMGLPHMYNYRSNFLSLTFITLFKSLLRHHLPPQQHMNLLKESFQTYIEGSLFQNTLHPPFCTFFSHHLPLHRSESLRKLQTSSSFVISLPLSHPLHHPSPQTSTFSHHTPLAPLHPPLTTDEIESLKQVTGHTI